MRSPQDGRKTFIGGSDARTILHMDQSALLRLWREKRGEIEPEDLSGNLAVQLGCATEALNRTWFERETGRWLKDVQRSLRHPTLPWTGATLDGTVESQAAVFEAKFMLPWNFSDEVAADKYMSQLQHNMLVTGAKRACLSILTGGAKWVLIEVEADPVYQTTVLLRVGRLFWRCVQTGEPPRVFGAEPPKAKIAAMRLVDMTASNAWAEHAAIFVRTQAAYEQHVSARAELKVIVDLLRDSGELFP
jgi:predicted phage-related endonuclease